MDRRTFLKEAGATALGANAIMRMPLAKAEGPEEPSAFRSNWPRDLNRPWPGPEYWANPLQDWRIRAGRLECFSPGGDRNVALLSHDVSARRGDLRLSVELGPLDSGAWERGFIGFRVGVKDAQQDYRATAIYGRGMNAGINADGRLFIGELEGNAPRAELAGEHTP